MARYFFDSWDGDTFLRDEVGIELDGIESARLAAQGGLADLAKDKIPKNDSRDLAIEVRDGSGQLFRATLQYEVQRLSS